MIYGGYPDEIFVNPPKSESDLRCIICLHVVRDAVKCPMDHGFCRSCIQKALIACGTCPGCRTVLNKDSLMAHRLLNNIIGDYEVICESRFDPVSSTVSASRSENNDEQNKRQRVEECAWQGDLNELEAHMSSCEYKTVPCPYCFMKVRVRDVKTHQQMCHRRPLPCKHCNSIFPGGEHEKCSEELIKCEYCQQSIPRKELGSLVGLNYPPFDRNDTHKLECPMIVIKCPYRSATKCAFKCVRKDMPSHVMDVIEHMTGLLEQTVKNKAESEVLKIQISIMNERIQIDECNTLILILQRNILAYPKCEENTTISTILKKMIELTKAPDVNQSNYIKEDLPLGMSHRSKIMREVFTSKYLGSILSIPRKYKDVDVRLTLEFVDHLLFKYDRHHSLIRIRVFDTIFNSVVKFAKPFFKPAYPGSRAMILPICAALSRLFMYKDQETKFNIWEANLQENVKLYVERNILKPGRMRGICRILTGVIYNLTDAMSGNDDFTTILKLAADILKNNVNDKTTVKHILYFYETMGNLIDEYVIIFNDEVYEYSYDEYLAKIENVNRFIAIIISSSAESLLRLAIVKYSNDNQLVMRCNKIITKCCTLFARVFNERL